MFQPASDGKSLSVRPRRKSALPQNSDGMTFRIADFQSHELGLGLGFKHNILAADWSEALCKKKHLKC